MPVDLNFAIAAPLLALAAGALLILLLDLIFGGEDVQGAIYLGALGSVVLAGYYLLPIARLAPDAQSGFAGWLVMDRFALVFSGILLVAALLAILVAVTRPMEDRSGFLALLLWAAMGMVTLTAAGNLMTVFLGIELLSLALYVMIAFDPTRSNAREAAFKYFVLGSVASAFLIFGFALMYGAVGTMDLAAIRAAAASGTATGLFFKVGVGLAVVGLAFKMALVPFHVWAPDVYQGASTAVTAYMAIGTKAAAFAAMARILVAAVPAEQQAAFLTPLSVLAFLSMMLGSTAGIWQDDLKRLIAYSGIANAGYLIMAIPGLGEQGLSAAAYYLAAYGLTIMGVFSVVRLVEEDGYDGTQLSELNGLFYRSPVLGAALALFMFGLAGLPPAGTFVGKFLLAIAAVKGGAWLVLTGLILSTGISAYVYLRVIGAAFRKAEEVPLKHAAIAGGQPGYEPARFAAWVALFIAFIGTLWLGVVPGPVTELLTVAFAA